MKPPAQPAATVVIATRNRKPDLQVLLASLRAQTVPLAILVLDDASTDGTAAMLAADFPEVNVVAESSRQGQSELRRKALELVNTEFFVSLDDDTELFDPATVERGLALFSRPDIAVVALPFENVLENHQLYHAAPAEDGVYIANSYIAAAFIARTGVFRKLGGYRGFLLHRHEEEELSYRLMDAGYHIRFGCGTPLRHYVSPRRDRREIVFLDQRNIILVAWIHLPWYAFLYSLFSYAVRLGRRLWTGPHRLAALHGYCTGLLLTGKYRALRQPIQRSTYALRKQIFAQGGLLRLAGNNQSSTQL
jgi:glycosyltransferase involved in cell wall biosynthesis